MRSSEKRRATTVICADGWTAVSLNGIAYCIANDGRLVRVKAPLPSWPLQHFCRCPRRPLELPGERARRADR